MNALDIAILVVGVLGLVKGYVSGFFRQVVSIVGFLAGLLVAFMLYATLGDWLAPYVGGSLQTGRALAFILLWVGVPVGLSLLAFVLTKAAEGVCLGGLNRLGGALLCCLKYMVFLSCVLNVADRVRLIPLSMEQRSHLYGPVKTVSAMLFETCKSHAARTVLPLMDAGVAD